MDGEYARMRDTRNDYKIFVKIMQLTTGFVYITVQWRTLLNTVINIWLP
jgi:hypothetical protein